MQLYAFDSSGQLIHARQADKHMNYTCLECQKIVRLRGGPQRQTHFYHLEPIDLCRQHQKGPIHLQLQLYFLQELPSGDCKIEYPFPSINRIADVVWFSQKLVFEIQCSPISAEEVMSRNRDYEQEGWSVVWILHDQRYNQIRLSAAEMALSNDPHYFTNMDSQGLGMIYDQFDICEQSLRIKRLAPLQITFNDSLHAMKIPKQKYPLNFLIKREVNWKYFFKGDVMSLFLDGKSSHYLKIAADLEHQYYPRPTLTGFLLKYWLKLIAKPYQVFFRYILERSCR